LGFVNPGLLLFTRFKDNMVFLQIPKNFEFKPFFPISESHQYEGSPSSSSHHIVISFEDKSPFMPLSNSI
jgi:hypothetical protein